MEMEKAIRVLAGTLVLASVALAYLVSPWWLLLAAFVGLNLVQSAFTGLCPAEKILAKLGIARPARQATKG
ncbi:MAG: DUF2892 domain-containing protein [Candidatus Dadabacteria bacterium]|nr:MAG: DUF2892 domain-containing protein [Candidatus Dadabacteria bacterium]